MIQICPNCGNIMTVCTEQPEKEPYTPIETMQFSNKTLNALINGGFGSVEQLLKTNYKKIKELRFSNSKVSDEIKRKLKEKGLSLKKAVS